MTSNFTPESTQRLILMMTLAIIIRQYKENIVSVSGKNIEIVVLQILSNLSRGRRVDGRILNKISTHC